MSGAASGEENDAHTVVVEQLDPTPVAEQLPRSLSRYAVLGEVGLGGMGRVLRAYDPKLQREVALKKVRADSLDGNATERLVAEARAMAKLSHPNVVAVYDVDDTEEASVVLVMEFVPGRSLRRWLREADHSWQDVLSVFLDAGRGLVAAHEAGLLHRDFKPANVLVSDDGAVKVTDFGLAKTRTAGTSSEDVSVDSFDDLPRASTDTLTAAGAVMGTPRYMAPEQHRGGSDHLTPAADQFAFCVALWEGLCGSPPFSGRDLADLKTQGPPPWPDAATPREIVDAIRRGLAPEPSARWPSMKALLEVLAWDPASRRRRMGLVGAAVLIVATGSYAVWASDDQACTTAREQLAGIWDAPRKEAVKSAILGLEQPYVEATWARVERELDNYADAWVGMHTEACEATAVRGEQSPRMLDLRMACLHRASVELDATVSTLADANERAVEKAHELLGGLRPLAECADPDILAREVEPPLPKDADAVERARMHLAKSESSERAGLYDVSLEFVTLAKADLEGVDYLPVQAEVALQEGRALQRLGRYEDADRVLADAMRLASRARLYATIAEVASELVHLVGFKLGNADEGLRYRALAEGLSAGNPRLEAEVAMSVGSALIAAGVFADGEAQYRKALEVRTETLGPDHTAVAYARANVALSLLQQGRFDDAVAEMRVVHRGLVGGLGADHPEVARNHHNLGVALTNAGQLAEAETEFRAALRIRSAVWGEKHPLVIASRNGLAAAFAQQGRTEEAEAEFRAVATLGAEVLGPEHPNVASARNNRANTLSILGRHEEAEAEHRAVVELRRKVLREAHPDLATSIGNLANTLSALDRDDEAEPLLREALAMMVTVLGDSHPRTVEIQQNLGRVLAMRGKLEEAETVMRAVLEHHRDASGGAATQEHPSVAVARRTLASILHDLDRDDEALPLAESAWARLERDEALTDEKARAASVLGRILWDVEPPDRDRARGRKLVETARAFLDDDADEAVRSSLDAWLAEHGAG